MFLHNLSPNKGSNKKSKRIGRGQGSGKGGTSTKGHKGDQSRSGYFKKYGFEGGQMPIQRRLPKFGFVNPFRVDYSIVNVESLQMVVEDNPNISEFTPQVMESFGLIKNQKQPVKVLGRGEISSKLKIQAHKFSESALELIQKAGGQAVVIGE